jgi:hypothetical protein
MPPVLKETTNPGGSAKTFLNFLWRVSLRPVIMLAKSFLSNMASKDKLEREIKKGNEKQHPK